MINMFYENMELLELETYLRSYLYMLMTGVTLCVCMCAGNSGGLHMCPSSGEAYHRGAMLAPLPL
jgi:hypothetical protein